MGLAKADDAVRNASTVRLIKNGLLTDQLADNQQLLVGISPSSQKEIKGMAGSLANPNFADKAPAEVVAECKANLAEAETQADLARRHLQDLD